RGPCPSSTVGSIPPGGRPPSPEVRRFPLAPDWSRPSAGHERDKEAMRVLRRLGVAVAAALVVIVAAAPAASAHAVLLRTDPAPQTTVKKAPAVVRLDFSEPVEVSFGAIRVFDVDANRVDRGSIRRAQGG